MTSEQKIKAFDIEPELIDVPMPIVTDRLIFRPPQRGDGKTVSKAIKETKEELNLWLPWSRGKRTHMAPHVECNMIKENAKFTLRENLMMIGFERQSGDPVVFTGLHDVDWRIRRFEIGYWVRKSAQGKGYATEATNSMLRYAFNALSARVVIIGHATGNHTSEHIIKKLGFEHPAIVPYDHEMPDGTLVDNIRYCRFNDDNLPPLNIRWGAEP